MRIKALIFVVFSVILTTSVMAQEKQKASFKKKIKEDEIENIDSLKFVADSLLREIVRRDSLSSLSTKLIDSLRTNVMQVSTVAKHQQDSLINIIRLKDSEITKLKADRGFVDTCMVKLANRWLYVRFDKADVDEAIKYFDRIYSSKLKEKMSIVQELLHNYERSYREFQSIIKEAQSDIDRESPFALELYRDKYKRKIENMDYYRKYYNGDWNIIYLKEQITEALKILSNHTNGKYSDFSTLIDPNF